MRHTPLFGCNRTNESDPAGRAVVQFEIPSCFFTMSRGRPKNARVRDFFFFVEGTGGNEKTLSVFARAVAPFTHARREKREETRERGGWRRRAGRTTRTPVGQSTSCSSAPALSSGGRRSPCKSHQLRRRKDGVRKACVFHQASLRAGRRVARAR